MSIIRSLQSSTRRSFELDAFTHNLRSLPHRLLECVRVKQQAALTAEELTPHRESIGVLPVSYNGCMRHG